MTYSLKTFICNGIPIITYTHQQAAERHAGETGVFGRVEVTHDGVTKHFDVRPVKGPWYVEITSAEVAA